MTISRLASNRVAPYNISSIGWDVATASSGDGTITLAWPAMPNAVGYAVQVSGQAPIILGNVLTHAVTGLVNGQSYTVSVVGIDSAGAYSGSASPKTVTVTTFNLATGGIEATVTNYNGTGQTWRTHTFSSSGTLAVARGPLPFTTLVVGGGGAGGNGGSAWNGGGGGSGGATTFSTTTTLAAGNVTVTVGGGGGISTVGNGEWQSGNPGSQSALGAITAAGGAGGPGAVGGNGGAGALSGGTNYNITGATVLYGQNGSSGGGNPNAGAQSSTQGGGGGGAVVGSGGPFWTGASNGRNGVVIVAYRIG